MSNRSDAVPFEVTLDELEESMPELPPPEQTLSFEGPEGESFFWSGFVIACAPANLQAIVQKEIDAALAHLSSEDDRAVALVGAILVESAVDELIAAYVPGYKALAKRRDFTASIRIELARALKLCPGRLLCGADTIRRIRNDFAHDLTIKTFGDCERGHLDSARDLLRSINSGMADGKSERKIFEYLVTLLRLGLLGCKFNVERLNQYVREVKAFRDGFRDYLKAGQPALRGGPLPEEDAPV